MAKALPLATAHMIGFVIALMLYGVYFALFFLTLCAYKRSPRAFPSFDIVRCAIITLFILTTAQVGLFILDIFEAFIRYQQNPGTDPFFDRKNDPIGSTKDVLLYTSGLVGDMLICWRLYMIWSRSVRVIILPLITLSSYAVGAVLIAYYEYRGVPEEGGPHYVLVEVLSLCCLLLGLITNCYTTSLIVGRLWWTGRQVQLMDDLIVRDQKNWYSSIIRAIVESGALYTMAILTTIIISASVPGSAEIFGYTDAMIAGIAPTLLVMQLHITRFKVRDRDGPAMRKSAAVSTVIQFRQTDLLEGDSKITVENLCSTIQDSENQKSQDLPLHGEPEIELRLWATR